MKTYKEHYKECQRNYESDVSIYDLKYKRDCVAFDIDNFTNLRKKVKFKLDYRIGCHDTKWAVYLDDWREIKEIENFMKEVVPQIEKNIMGCFAKVEFVHIYETKKTASEEASWIWHYDDCPPEFIKFAIYLSDVYDNNGPMEIIPEVIESYRTNPESIKGHPPPVFPKSRVPREYLKGKEKITLKGKAGTNFVFTPNIIHRGTVPTALTRVAMFLFIRPSLAKIDNYCDVSSSYLPMKNVKRYELD
tara:strand:+ start:4263 stop:5003 length:741 start_codon:yes stop_codon:yes gene_type:complete